MANTAASEIETRVKAAAAILKIEHLMERRPGQLSGGQRQRVAIGRAIVRKPDVFLFDEPLSNLDAELRVSMRIEIARLHRELGNTMIYVTHDQTEAMTLADKIVVLRDGRVEQEGTPRTLYENPDNLFVAGFIGSPRMNMLEATWTGDGMLNVAGSKITAPIAGQGLQSGQKLTFGIRPEHLKVSDTADGGIQATVDFDEYLGGTQFLYCQLDDGQPLTVEYREGREIAAGSRIAFTSEAGQQRIFDGEGKRVRG
jgi:lactose/L-arabinose transport system ATP-binding protein